MARPETANEWIRQFLSAADHGGLPNTRSVFIRVIVAPNWEPSDNDQLVFDDAVAEVCPTLANLPDTYRL